MPTYNAGEKIRNWPSFLLIWIILRQSMMFLVAQLGNMVLKEIAFRIQSVLRESDTVARLGGDEFCDYLA